MTSNGEIMKSEIAQTPAIFAKIIGSNLITEQLANILIDNDIHSILILARGTSDNAAHYLKYLIETQLGLPCGLTSPSSISIYNSKLHFKNTLLVAISQSGRSTDLNLYADAAKKAGAIFIAITNDDGSPLSLNSDYHLPLQAGPELAVAATKSYSSQLLLSYLLVMAWAKNDPKLEALVSESKRLVSTDVDIFTISKKIDIRKPLVVLGRGFAYPNAKESALKIQETCKINVFSMSTADYLHGPISALDSETQVIFVSPFGMPNNAIEDAVVKIREKTEKIFWIGAGGHVSPGDIEFGGSRCSDELTSSIADSIVLQEVSLNLAVLNGFNPDAPEGLSKVTLTL